ncbi:hypothetical protein niasHT_007526 [Heterodera trifolii]|uniref:Kinesin-like protein n=1 Tax=Heterodera trifolii TaxID=157864 RepID=A0ABD2LPF5_9BILA
MASPHAVPAVLSSPSSSSILVAVRVRPFSEREKKRKAQLIVRMIDGSHTELRDPTGRERQRLFTFDHSYWSHDGFRVSNDGHLVPETRDYADQKRVFDDLGAQVLRNAWAGFNCALFAYGQTGSGKSYSMVGLGKNRGLVPMICDEMFHSIEAEKMRKGTTAKFKVTVSMFEIYCEKVRDLLSANPTNKGPIKVREHPKNGFYVEGLSSWPVASYRAVEKLLNEGTRARTIAATNMNTSSSRAHSIFRIEFTQKFTSKTHSTRTSEIFLVDLAGSERLKGMPNGGERQREGIRINQSLSTLGRVIKALYDRQNGNGTSSQQKQIPYRDSVLTSLLKNAFGGNSKTIMIATISPADLHYEETLSTLRFADRMKAIRTVPVVNESATERLIRTIRSENDRLLRALERGELEEVAEKKELEALRRQLADNQREMEKLERNWQQREETFKKEMSAMSLGELEQSLNAYREETPHLWNLNEDPALSDVIVHFLEKGDNKIGSGPNAQIQLKGMSILSDHALVRNRENKRITLMSLNGAEILVNGKRILTERELRQNDRILFGANHLYVFSNRKERKKQAEKGEKMISYEMAQKEIARQNLKSLSEMADKKSKDEFVLEEELVSVLPYVYRANSMAAELRQAKRFEIVLMPQKKEDGNGRGGALTEIWVKVHDNSVAGSSSSSLWDISRFMSRYYRMQELYEKQLEEQMDEEHSSTSTAEQRQCEDKAAAAVRIGTVTVFLQSLAYLVGTADEVPIQNYHGAQVGWLKVELRVRAWDEEGEEEGKGKGRGHDDQRLLVGRNMSVTVGIVSARSLPRSVDQCFCKYRFFDLETITTSKQSGPNPVFSHQKTLLFRPLTQQLVDYFKEGTLTIDVFVTYRTEEKRPQIGGTLRQNPSTGGGSEGRNATMTRRSRSSTSSTRAKQIDGMERSVERRNEDTDVKEEAQKQRKRVEWKREKEEETDRRTNA